MAQNNGIVWRENNEVTDLFQQQKHDAALQRNLQARQNSTFGLKSSVRYRPFVDVINPVNQEFSDLRAGISIASDPDFGRHIVATQNIPACIKIGEARPFALVVDKTEHLYCLTCNESQRRSYVDCEHCDSVVFCAPPKDCSNVNRTHEYECGSNFHNITYGRNLDIKLAIQMVFETCVAYADNVQNLMNDVTRMLNGENKIGFEIPGQITNARSKFAAIMRLEGKHRTNLELRAQQAYLTIIDLPAVQAVFDTTDARDQRFLQLLLAHFLMIIPKNSFEEPLPLIQRRNNQIPIPSRMMIFDTFSYFNHACSPNVLAFMEWNCMTLFTSRPISQTEQLCIAYKYFDQNVHRAERQAFLRRSWGFDCQCERCEYYREINNNDMRIVNQKTSRHNNMVIAQKFATVELFQTQMKKVIQVQRQRTHLNWTARIGACAIKYHDVLNLRAL